MALDYTLAVIGETSPLALAERLGFTREDFEHDGKRWVADRFDERGFVLIIMRHKDGYFQYDDWEIEPARYLSASFRINKWRSYEACRAIDALVEQVLTTGDEDLVYEGPDFCLRLERTAGVVRRINP
jgi:hypothetical protein